MQKIIFNYIYATLKRPEQVAISLISDGHVPRVPGALAVAAFKQYVFPDVIRYIAEANRPNRAITFVDLLAGTTMWDTFKLVMIDDDPMEHLVMKKMLSRYDLFKNSAHSFDGRTVIDSLKENCDRPEALPDVIFTDLNMTRFTGWLFLEQFKLLRPSLKKDIDVYVISSSPIRPILPGRGHIPLCGILFINR